MYTILGIIAFAILLAIPVVILMRNERRIRDHSAGLRSRDGLQPAPAYRR